MTSMTFPDESAPCITAFIAQNAMSSSAMLNFAASVWRMWKKKRKSNFLLLIPYRMAFLASSLGRQQRTTRIPPMFEFYFMFTRDERDLNFSPRIDLPILSVGSPATSLTLSSWHGHSRKLIQVEPSWAIEVQVDSS